MRKIINKQYPQKIELSVVVYLTIMPICLDSLLPDIQSKVTEEVLIVWEEIDAITNFWTVIFNSLPFSREWLDPVPISQVSQNSLSLGAAINSAGNAEVLWVSQDPIDRNNFLYFSKKTLLGSWSIPVLISLSTDNIIFENDFAFLDNGRVRVVWRSNLDEAGYTSVADFLRWAWSEPLLISNLSILGDLSGNGNGKNRVKDKDNKK